MSLEFLLVDRLGFSEEFETRSRKIKEDIGKIVLEPHKERFIAERIAIAQVTASYQNRIGFKPPLLGGLVIHGGLQGWWIAPVFGNLVEIPLMFSATALTAFNDKAAITLGARGIEGIMELSLDHRDQKAFNHSAETIRQAISNAMDLM